MSEILNTDIKELNEKINKESAIIDIIMLEMNKVIVGQKKYDRKTYDCSFSKWACFIRGSSWAS
jgi:hypothetical protein